MLKESLHLSVLTHQAAIGSVQLSPPVHKLFVLLLSVPKPSCLKHRSLLAIVKLNLQPCVFLMALSSGYRDFCLLPRNREQQSLHS